jgi:hypothetical protein
MMGWRVLEGRGESKDLREIEKPRGKCGRREVAQGFDRD